GMRGLFSTPITPLPGSFFHADPQSNQGTSQRATRPQIKAAWSVPYHQEDGMRFLVRAEI
ncbi:hypothetical protein, partial [Sphingomonas sp. CFBP 13728]|uniref:hypothetical protein n=1 Tax=Sphingomonas sp. CFBP 13728 TaxID=2775294 RepID=UPI001A7E8B0E